jgi:hypothetical protein
MQQANHFQVTVLQVLRSNLFMRLTPTLPGSGVWALTLNHTLVIAANLDLNKLAPV